MKPTIAPARTARALLGTMLLTAATLSAAIDGDALRRHVKTLASEAHDGRLTGTGGAALAADYIVAELEKLGVQPLPGRSSLRLDFEFTAGTNDAGSSLTLFGEAGEESWRDTEHVMALSLSSNGSVKAPVVFAGYGIEVPEGQDLFYSSYTGLDVDGKIVLVLRYFPEDAEQETRTQLARYAGLRAKAMQARERGAKALVVFTGPRSPNAGETIAMSFDTAISGSGILAASISGEVAEQIFSRAGKDLTQVQKSLDDANPHVTGFDLPGAEIELEVKVERERRSGYNIAGWLPATEAGAIAQKPYVVVGAHYDHLGHGRHGNSLATKEEAGGIHFGADDNASGVAALLEAASELASKERRRGVVVAFWSGEELGLLGSSDFVDDEDIPVDQIAAYVNFDMVGRVSDNKLALQAVGSSAIWPRLIERANIAAGFDLKLQDDPYLPTDSTTFNIAKVPTLNFFTGSHEDYHRPSDVAAKINYDDLARVAKLGAAITDRLANLEDPPQFVEVERKVETGGSRDSVRAYTGTIPDYTTEVEGLMLSGVMGGGPADEAGLQEGDVIIQFGSQEITNIYDYTYALDAVKIGEPLAVVFLRGGERMETIITPRARK